MSTPPGPPITAQQIRENTLALRPAIRAKDLAELTRLIPISDPRQDDSIALWLAASRNDFDAVRLLLPHSNPAAQDFSAIRALAANGRAQMLSMFMSCLSGREKEDAAYAALLAASTENHETTIHFLLETIASAEQKRQDSRALRTAARNGHAATFALLVAKCENLPALVEQYPEDFAPLQAMTNAELDARALSAAPATDQSELSAPPRQPASKL